MDFICVIFIWERIIITNYLTKYSPIVRNLQEKILTFKNLSEFLSKPFLKDLIKFAIVGAIGTVINLSILFILTEFFNLYYLISEIIAFLVSVLNNYILNKLWTFKEKIQEKLVRKYFKFSLICVISLVLNISVLFILVEYFYLWYIIAEIIAILCAFLINFSGSWLWTFKKNKIEENT